MDGGFESDKSGFRCAEMWRGSLLPLLPTSTSLHVFLPQSRDGNLPSVANLSGGRLPPLLPPSPGGPITPRCLTILRLAEPVALHFTTTLGPFAALN